MLTLFKIFLFLFLQQGIKSKNWGEKFNWDTILLSENSILTIQADPLIIETIVIECTKWDPSCEITKEVVWTSGGVETERTSVAFKNLTYTARNKMMERLKTFQYSAFLIGSDQY